MLVRPARPQELDAVESLYGEVIDAMIGTPFDIMWRRGEHPSRSMLEGAASAGELLVAEDESGLVGSVVLNALQAQGYERVPWPCAAAPAEVRVVHALAAHPRARGKGVGAALLGACLDRARGKGAHALRFDVVPTNEPAIALYRRLGFCDCGLHELRYEGFDPLPFRMFEMVL